MKKKTRSLLEELDTVVCSEDRKRALETRANHVITSAINILEMINESYDADTARELERRLINSIKGRDVKKFTRGIRKID